MRIAFLLMLAVCAANALGADSQPSATNIDFTKPLNVSNSIVVLHHVEDVKPTAEMRASMEKIDRERKEHPLTNGVTSRWADVDHWFQFQLVTNGSSTGQLLWQTNFFWFKGFGREPWAVADVHLDNDNLVVVYRIRSQLSGVMIRRQPMPKQKDALLFTETGWRYARDVSINPADPSGVYRVDLEVWETSPSNSTPKKIVERYAWTDAKWVKEGSRAKEAPMPADAK